MSSNNAWRITRPSVYDMNTQAVVKLNAGRVDEAMRGFRDTLIHTRSLLQGLQGQSHQACSTSASSKRPTTSSSSQGSSTMDCYGNGSETKTIPLSIFSVPLSEVASKLPNSCDDDSAQCPIFNKVFVLGNDDGTEDDWLIQDEHCQNVTLGVLLYNLALCHHLVGIARGHSDELRIALSLYQMSLSLLDIGSNHPKTRRENGSHEECQNVVLLLLAIFNNSANIHSRHFNREETRSCLACLKEIVEYYADHQALTSVEDDHFFFYLNLFVTAPVEDFAISPAA